MTSVNAGSKSQTHPAYPTKNDQRRDRGHIGLSSSGNHTVPLIGRGKLLGYLVQKRDLADWYGLKLASNIPDQGSGMKWNIRVIAYLIEYGNGRCGLYRLVYALVHEDGLDALCRAPDIPRDCIIAHNTF